MRQMRARIATIPDGRYHGRAWVDSDGVVDEPLTIAAAGFGVPHTRPRGAT